MCSWLMKKVAKFFGVADLSQEERARFYDKWMTRAQKMHDDDLLLTRRQLRPTKHTGAIAEDVTDQP